MAVPDDKFPAAQVQKTRTPYRLKGDPPAR